jgi:invasion protein IalB
MTEAVGNSSAWTQLVHGAAAAVAAGALAAALAMGPACAQEGDATAASKDDKKNVSSWVKLCEKAPLKKGEDPKEICITHHERLDPGNGTIIVSAAVRTIEGVEKPRFLVTVPLGMALPPGMFARIDEEKEGFGLKYSFCLPHGCTAEVDATPELLKKFSEGKAITVATINAVGEQVGFQVPLNGFTQTYEGKPVDTAKFANARKELLMRIREQAIKRAQAAAEKKKAGAEGEANPEGEQQQQ